MRFLHFMGVVFFLIATPASARDASAWILAQKSGDVRVLKNGVQPASVQIRSSLSAGDLISTGANGRAMLTNGNDYVIVAPSSRLVLPKEQQQSGFTRLIQQVGTMLYKVKHTGVPHFSVETPMLAAVVKGTSFTVVVDEDRAAVQVTQGVVEVSSAVGSARRLVEGGMTVYIGRERPDAIIEMKPGASGLPSSNGAVKIESSGDASLGVITDLTGGLVREAPAPVAPVTTVAVSDVTNVTPVTSTAPTSADVAPVAGSTAADVVQATAPTVADPVAVAGTTAPSVSDPVVAVVQPTVLAVTEPVVQTVQTTVPTVTEPVVQVVQTVVPAVTQPVVQIAQTTVPTVTEPVVQVVQTTVPVVTQPVVQIVEATVPVVTQPVVTVVPVVTQPVVTVVQTVVPVIPVVTQPILGGGILGGGNGP